MSATETNARVIAAPEVLGLESRGGFRDESVEILGQLPETGGALIIDFAGTRRIDGASCRVPSMIPLVRRAKPVTRPFRPTAAVHSFNVNS